MGSQLINYQETDCKCYLSSTLLSLIRFKNFDWEFNQNEKCLQKRQRCLKVEERERLMEDKINFKILELKK